MAKRLDYCTHAQLKRIFPQIDSFDTKTPIYNWTSGLADYTDSSLDIFYAVNTGLVTNLYKDGVELRKITYPVSATTEVATEMVANTANLVVDTDDGSSFTTADIIKVNSEYMVVNAVSTDTISLSSAANNRGLFGTSTAIHAVDSDVFIVIDKSVDLPSVTAASDAPIFVYDKYLDMCLLIGDDLTTDDPNDNLMESGEDWFSLVAQILTDASRYLDSRLDPNLPREQLKDKSGNFDYIIIRTTGLIAATFILRSTDPTSEMATALMEEAMGNIDALNSGNAALSWQTSRDASKGVIRDVVYTANSVRPLDTRGAWYGTYDLIKVKIILGGEIGTATYSVWTKNGDKLGVNEGTQVVTAETINGDYQTLAGGLQIRFGGDIATAVAVANDIWEIEVIGANEHVDASGVKSVNNSRWL